MIQPITPEPNPPPTPTTTSVDSGWWIIYLFIRPSRFFDHLKQMATRFNVLHASNGVASSSTSRIFIGFSLTYGRDARSIRSQHSSESRIDWASQRLS